MRSKKISSWRVVLTSGHDNETFHVTATAPSKLRQTRTVATLKEAKKMYDEIQSVRDISYLTFNV